MHQDNGKRASIYIAENSHATYFRYGNIDTAKVGCGSQVQYDDNPDGSYDRIGYGNDPIVPKLEELSTSNVFHWADRPQGQWGQTYDHPGPYNGEGVPSPRWREAAIEEGPDEYFELAAEPGRFHTLCRKEEIEDELELK